MIVLAAALFLAPNVERDPCAALTPAQYEKLSEHPERTIDKAGEGLWIGGIAFAPSDLQSAVASIDPLIEEWSIELTFTPSGQVKFRDAQHCGVNRTMEISVDRRLVSRPVLREEIMGNQVRISGGFDEASATALAARLAPPR